MAKYDLILSGGTVLDPANDFEGIADVGVKDGLISQVEPDLDPFDAEGDCGYERALGDARGRLTRNAHVAGLARNWDPALGYAMLGGAQALRRCWTWAAPDRA